MPITTIDGALAGMRPPLDFVKSATPTLVAGRPHSLWYLTGVPGAASAPATGVSGTYLVSPITGQIPYTNPVTGSFSYMARLQAMATIGGTLLLCDRIWHNSGLNVTGTIIQVITNSGAILGRDYGGFASGTAVQAALEVNAAMGVGTPTLTINYLDQTGATGTSTNIDAVIASSAQGAFYRFGLAADDTGIRRLLTYQANATMTSGGISLVLYRVLASLELTVANIGNAIDALTAGFPQLYDGTVPFLVFIPSTTTASIIAGQVVLTQG
jgi:hypothetical protein